MAIQIKKIQLLLQDEMAAYTLHDEENPEYRTLVKPTDLTYDGFVAMLRSHYGYMTDTEINELQILNPDTNEYQSVSEFLDYIKMMVYK